MEKIRCNCGNTELLKNISESKDFIYIGEGHSVILIGCQKCDHVLFFKKKK